VHCSRTAPDLVAESALAADIVPAQPSVTQKSHATFFYRATDSSVPFSLREFIHFHRAESIASYVLTAMRRHTKVTANPRTLRASDVPMRIASRVPVNSVCPRSGLDSIYFDALAEKIDLIRT